jgi:hypothetical protein
MSLTLTPTRKPPQTPIIAGSVCGGVLILAWIIGFSIYFRKRWKRKQLNRAAAAIGMPPPEVKSRPQTEKVVIPPDPAVLLSQRQPGYVFAETEYTHAQSSEQSSEPVAVKPAEATRNVDASRHARLMTNGGVSPGDIGAGTSEKRGREQRPLLTVMTKVPDISALQQPRGVEKGHGTDG